MNLLSSIDLFGGGPGSGRHPYGRKDRTKSARARATYKPATKEIQAKADKSEEKLAKALGGERTKNNAPFDIMVGSKVAVEVKTIIDNKNDKITMHPESRMRKEKEAAEKKLVMFTVAVDIRGGSPKYYVKDGVGAFRLYKMDQLSLSGLKDRITNVR